MAIGQDIGCDLPVCFDDLLSAKPLVQAVMAPTPMLQSKALSEVSGAEVWLKLENLNTTGSFKERGACVKLSRLPDGAQKKGVIACSAGNHAQGVAYHAQRLGLSATIVMPEGTPFSKINRTEALGADVRLIGQDFNAAAAAAQEIMEREGRLFIPPFDDPDIIAGQGSCGLEIAEQMPDLDVLLVPIGGGGLISGVALATKTLCPSLQIIGVQVDLFPSMLSALSGRSDLEPRPVIGGQTLAEGIAVKYPGKLTKAMVEVLVDDILLVGEDSIEQALVELLEQQKIVVEGAGAAPLAALLSHPGRFRGKKVGLILSGGNIDSRLLATSLLRGLGRKDRLVNLRVSLEDRPGELGRLTSAVGKVGGNIIEIYHDRMFYDVSVKIAEVDMVVESRDQDHLARILSALRFDGFAPRRLSARGGDGRAA